MSNFDTITALAIVLLAAAIHASFQLSVSVLTLLSGHALSRKAAHKRLVGLGAAFIVGAGIMTTLILSTLAWVFSLSLTGELSRVMWALASGALFGVGLSVWLFYYRKEPGTSLWIPRGFAKFLSDRAKHSKNSAEVFGLGMTSVFAEMLFVFAPLFAAALALQQLRPELQFPGVLAYVGVSLVPLVTVGLLIGNGYKLSRIQKWREANKRFLQFVAGGGLLVLSMYVYVEQVVVSSVTAPGGF